jgi:glucose-1-phosphate thymidylyltransferase
MAETMLKPMKGIILAGGSGSRLHPVTIAVSKQLLPVYDKPMIYYPISMLMLGGIREILLISTPTDLPAFQRLLGDGSRFGVTFQYAEQPFPGGLAQALLIGSTFLAGAGVCLALGDNIFFGNDLGELMRGCASGTTNGGRIFAYHVTDPERYGVVEFDGTGRAISLEEKPNAPRSAFAVPGLYFYGPEAVVDAASLKPSQRGELEITDLNRIYLARGALRVERLGRGVAWFDTGTQRSLLDASNFIAAVEERQGLKVACLEEIALTNGWISADNLRNHIVGAGKSVYVDYLRDLLARDTA